MVGGWSDQEQALIFEYREGEVIGPQLMTVTYPFRTTARLSGFLFFDMADPKFLGTISGADDWHLVCVNRWDMEQEKHDKTVIVATSGWEYFNVVLLRNQQLLAKIRTNEGEQRLVVVDINTGNTVKTVGIEQHWRPPLISPTNGNVMLGDGLLLNVNDLFEKVEDTMWRGNQETIRNQAQGDVFCGMNKTKLVGHGASMKSIVVMDFWDVEDVKDGSDEVEGGVSSGEQDRNLLIVL